ncbi:MAG: hypothetical protein A3J93_05400 [Candidatus Magasanikbacteria bacterium RIFOXYC2_FULL_42_28]|uniref:YgjP-like metallopeptidase domain-containing protein n=1 Tax=Candidatus Magasanikbacteria bacterium RIFOXYC2_FULL_42_28 TaxID=1798704 RepID=A0A1F6NV85_9BACT|nr:MAG: hypothetical protein A3J93_05400 [Candidatus Magasanikbacteria bacterium RIFOXYC2_FULL_42_28]
MKTTLNNREIEYAIRKSTRARNLRLTVNCDASVVVTVPRYFFGMYKIERFLQAKASWVLRKIDYFKKFGNRVRVGESRLGHGGRREYKKYREQARALIAQKITQLNQTGEFVFNRISIKNHKSRWGSCSKKKNLNFNYKIVFLPEHLAEYIVAHELCHLKELNHSRKFWNLVAEFVPDYKEQRRALKRVVF